MSQAVHASQLTQFAGRANRANPLSVASACAGYFASSAAIVNMPAGTSSTACALCGIVPGGQLS